MPATEEPALLPTAASRRRPEEPKVVLGPAPPAASPPSDDANAEKPLAGAVIIGSAGPQPTSITSTSETANQPAEPDAISMEPEKSAPVSSRAMTLMAVLAVLYTVYFARAVLLPISFGIVLSLVLRPVIRWLARKRVPEVVGATICLVALLVIVGFGVARLIGPAQEWMAAAPGHLAKAESKLHAVVLRMKAITVAKERIEEIAAGEGDVQPVPVEVQQPKLGNSALLLSAGGSMLASLVVVIVLAFFLLTSGDALINNVLTTLPKLSDKRRIVTLVQNVQKGVSSYLFTMSAINAGLAVAVSFAMWLIGLPNPGLWGVLAGSLNFVPYIGPLVCGSIIAFVSVLTFDSLGYAMVAPATFFAITSIEGNVLTPAILGRHMSLNPIMVFLFLIFWGWMWGVGGAVLAVPILAVLRITFDQFERTQPLGTMLGA